MNNMKQFKRIVPLLFFLNCSLMFSTQILAQDIIGEKLWPGFVYNSQRTWIIATSTQFVMAERSRVTDDSDFDWVDEDTVENVKASAPGVPIIPGSKPVDPEATSYSGFFSGENYLVEAPVEKVKRFYLQVDGKFCSIDDESPMAFEEGELMMTAILCLNHAGEVKAGDNVTVITIFKAPAPILSELIGSTQGDWAVFSIDSWVEENY